MTSEKSKTNKKWTSSAEFRDGYERIYGKKKLTPQQVEDKIDEWHRSNPDVKAPLYEFLGWTEGQYAAYVERGEIP